MDLNFLDGLIRILARTSVSEIEHSDGDQRIRLVRVDTVVPASSVKEEERDHPPVHPPVEMQPNQSDSPSGTHAITAGLVGTFYRSPSPDQPSFVSVGDLVHEGQTVAIVEAMKLLNAIEADLAGRIVEILVEDGATVSPDTVLFTIEPAEVENV
ncbi:biotin/lipoyl-binding protein [Paraburkholderia sediminicola]|uniref:acetyl-CoA carboxylase biotin carboxyl carrier protein n=1 Tax=Paraburkholderia TaxID=1822464 RepID=UPI0038BDE6BB